MKPFERYINHLKLDKDILEVYVELRHAFKREGWNEEDLKNPPYYPNDIMRNFQRFSDLHSKLFRELRILFPDTEQNEFAESLKEKLRKIDLKTPL